MHGRPMIRSGEVFQMLAAQVKPHWELTAAVARRTVVEAAFGIELASWVTRKSR
jgi:hypothetical protein